MLLRLKDLDDYEDAALMKQKVAACLAVVMTDADGTAAPIGRGSTPDDTIDTLEPGSILTAPAGRTVSVVNPPAVSEHDAFTKSNLRAVATALGLTYEDLTGDYAGLPFSAARMSRIRHWARVEDWRWGMLVPQLCDPVWTWAMQAASVVDAGVPAGTAIPVEWTAPAMPMIEPDKEGLAYARNIRAGIMTLSEAIRERGYDPERMLAEYRDRQRVARSARARARLRCAEDDVKPACASATKSRRCPRSQRRGHAHPLGLRAGGRVPRRRAPDDHAYRHPARHRATGREARPGPRAGARGREHRQRHGG